MLSRAGLLGKTCVTAASRQASRNMCHHGHHHPPLPTMNDMPLPSGSWQTAHASKQMKYNIILLGSITFFLSTVTYVATHDIIDFNWGPSMKNKKD